MIEFIKLYFTSASFFIFGSFTLVILALLLMIVNDENKASKKILAKPSKGELDSAYKSGYAVGYEEGAMTGIQGCLSKKFGIDEKSKSEECKNGIID